jgi:hypothetical protein
MSRSLLTVLYAVAIVIFLILESLVASRKIPDKEFVVLKGGMSEQADMVYQAISKYPDTNKYLPPETLSDLTIYGVRAPFQKDEIYIRNSKGQLLDRYPLPETVRNKILSITTFQHAGQSIPVSVTGHFKGALLISVMER